MLLGLSSRNFSGRCIPQQDFSADYILDDNVKNITPKTQLKSAHMWMQVWVSASISNLKSSLKSSLPVYLFAATISK
jgi:hypothetical protein